MTSEERVNYILAVIISLALHALLLVLIVPFGIFEGNTDIDVLSNGLMDISAVTETAKDLPKEAVAEPAVPQSVVAKKENIIEKKADIAKEKPLIKEEKNEEKIEEKKVVSKPTAVASDTPVSEPKTTTQGSGKAVSQPQSLGDGSGMFSRKGLLTLRAPKSVENEGIKGDVSLRIFVEPNGSIKQIAVLKSSGDIRLDQASINHVKREWNFKPSLTPYRVDAIFSFSDSGAALYKLLGAETIVDGGNK